MKKIFLASFAALFVAVTASAQTSKEKTGKEKATQSQVATPPKQAKDEGNVHATSKKSKSVGQPKKEDESQKLKKDGSPDMRYKENKDAKKPAGPMKKDGTPDMRYKDNKRSEGGKK